MLNLLNVDLNPGKATFGHPYSSITGVTANQVLVFTLLALFAVLLCNSKSLVEFKKG